MISPAVKIGVGTWAWGDRLIWNYGLDYDETDLRDVFRRAVRDDVTFFSTSEAFSEGKTETMLGDFLRQFPTNVTVSTKYVPRLWRMRRADFMAALKNSLERLQRPAIDIYEIMPPVGLMDIRLLVECAVEALDLGLVHQIGVSNFSLPQIEQFSEILNRFGHPIACLEVEYNLLDRSIENNGILDLCRQLNITLVAQNPLAMGFLSGRYDYRLPAEGSRRQFMRKYSSPAFELLVRLMKNIGSENGGKNCAQVSLNWLICKNVVPIPGAKTLAQVSENNQAINWRMSSEQESRLDELSSRLYS